MKHDYSVHIVWSKEDESYIAIVPELPECISDGETMEMALVNIQEVIRAWIKEAKAERQTIPSPMMYKEYRHIRDII